jgi:hypothetical protein
LATANTHAGTSRLEGFLMETVTASTARSVGQSRSAASGH